MYGCVIFKEEDADVVVYALRKCASLNCKECNYAPDNGGSRGSWGCSCSLMNNAADIIERLHKNQQQAELIIEEYSIQLNEYRHKIAKLENTPWYKFKFKIKRKLKRLFKKR